MRILSSRGKYALLALALIPASLFGGPKREAPRAAAELRFGISSEPSTLDPLSPANTADGRSILFNVFEGLVKIESDGSFSPAAAETWAVEENGGVYSFMLREGLKFHDGSALSPEDVVFSLNTAREARFTGFTQIQKIETFGERGLRIILREPDLEFLHCLTIGIVPRNNPDRERKPLGLGPFSIESYSPQRSLILRKNPYYRRGDIPKLEKVTVVFMADQDALLLGLRGGSIDGAGLTGALVEQLDPGAYDIVEGYSNMVQLLALNNEVKPLDDVRVRQAINYGVDVREIIDTAFYGRGEPSGSPLIPGLTRYYDRSLAEPYSPNREKARELLAQAGYPGGFDLEIAVPSNYTIHVDTAQVIVNQLARIGIRASIRLVEWAAWLADIYRGRKFQATIISLDAPIPSPRTFLSRYLSDEGSNFINFKSPAFDKVYKAILGEGDEDTRIGYYKEAQRIISREAAGVYIQDIYSFKVFPRGRYRGALNYPVFVIDFSTIEALAP